MTYIAYKELSTRLNDLSKTSCQTIIIIITADLTFVDSGFIIP